MMDGIYLTSCLIGFHAERGKNGEWCNTGSIGISLNRSSVFQKKFGKEINFQQCGNGNFF